MVNFIIERLHITGRCYAAVSAEGRNVTSDEVCFRLKMATGLTRHDIESVFRSLREIMSEELCEGNSVEIGELVSVKPDLRLRNPITGCADAVAEQVRTLTAMDVKFGCKVHLTRKYLYELMTLFRKRNFRKGGR